MYTAHLRLDEHILDLILILQSQRLHPLADVVKLQHTNTGNPNSSERFETNKKLSRESDIPERDVDALLDHGMHVLDALRSRRDCMREVLLQARAVCLHGFLQGMSQRDELFTLCHLRLALRAHQRHEHIIYHSTKLTLPAA
jgi:hypothetical protein